MTDLDTRARDAATGLRHAVGQFDTVELGLRPTKSHRRWSVVVGIAAIALVGIVVAIVATTRSNDEQEPAGSNSMWDRVSMRHAFGADTGMNDVIGTPRGFVATGAKQHRCPRSTEGRVCQSNHLWFSEQGQRWTEVSFPAL